MKLSIVSTLYRSAPYINEFCRRAGSAAQSITQDYEIILVNDGSPDDSLLLARALAQSDKHITVIDLSRNFGHHKAIMTGLSHSKGEFVFLIDSDLEEPPELLQGFWDSLASDTETDVVYGVQRTRKGGLYERVSGSLFYVLFNALSAVKIEKNMSVLRLMTRRYVDSLIQYREQELVFAGVAALAGYQQKSYVFDKLDKGISSYNIIHKLDMVANSIASFSNRPLYYIFYLGLVLTVSSMVLVTYFLGCYFILGNIVSGWTSLIISLWALGGIILLTLGLMGIYLAKMFNEVKDRPYTIVRAIYRGDA
ncbi:MAG: glycosyltransferase family 2 protein [Alphaproteobacteria bacterium]